MLKAFFIFLYLFMPHSMQALAQDDPIASEQISKAVVYLEGVRPKLETVGGVEVEVGIRRPGAVEFQVLTESVSGTGFFVRDAQTLFLVTASHVARALISNVRLTAADAGGSPSQFSLEGRIAWQYSLKADVAIARITSHDLTDFFLPKALDSAFLARDDQQVPVPEWPLVVIGFPLGLGVHGKFSPLHRETHGASFLIDYPRADTHQISTFFVLQDPSIGGYSGSPVFSTDSYRFGNTLLPGLDLHSCVGMIHGTISDDTGGKLALVTPVSFINEMLRLASGETTPH